MNTGEVLRLKEIINLVFKGGQGSGNFGHAGRPGEVGGSAENSISSNRVIANTWDGYDGYDVFEINDAKDIAKDYSTIAVSVKGDRKGRILASKNNYGHSRMIDAAGDNIDDYVRFSRVYEKGEYILEANIDYAAVFGWNNDFESSAMDNIYKATNKLVAKGMPANTKISILTPKGYINTTAKSRKETKR